MEETPVRFINGASDTRGAREPDFRPRLHASLSPGGSIPVPVGRAHRAWHRSHACIIEYSKSIACDASPCHQADPKFKLIGETQGASSVVGVKPVPSSHTTRRSISIVNRPGPTLVPPPSRDRRPRSTTVHGKDDVAQARLIAEACYRQAEGDIVGGQRGQWCGRVANRRRINESRYVFTFPLSPMDMVTVVDKGVSLHHEPRGKRWWHVQSSHENSLELLPRTGKAWWVVDPIEWPLTVEDDRRRGEEQRMTMSGWDMHDILPHATLSIAFDLLLLRSRMTNVLTLAV